MLKDQQRGTSGLDGRLRVCIRGKCSRGQPSLKRLSSNGRLHNSSRRTAGSVIAHVLDLDILLERTQERQRLRPRLLVVHGAD
jgi:hypothetical protein